MEDESKRLYTHEELVEEPIASVDVFSGVLLQVKNDTVRLPNQKTAKREWVDHPGASAIVPLFEDGSILLVEQYRYPVQRVMLEVPAGKRDGQEPFIETAVRELQEETGWKANKVHDLGASFPVIGYSNEIIHFFLAQDLERSNLHPEDDEFLNIIETSFEEALAMVKNGDILDMKSIVALLKVESYLAT